MAISSLPKSIGNGPLSTSINASRDEWDGNFFFKTSWDYYTNSPRNLLAKKYLNKSNTNKNDIMLILYL